MRNLQRVQPFAALGVVVGSSPGGLARYLLRIPGAVSRRLTRFVPGAVRRFAPARLASRTDPPVGRVRLGDLRRTTPISRVFGYDRGQPVDRHYIEAFLARHATDIRGRVLEIGDDAYTREFGADRVTRSDVLHVENGNPRATFVGDLVTGDDLPAGAFDCVVLTQTLHLIYDARAAVHTLHRILRPGGILLLTVPGISQLASDRWGATWYWSFTTLSARRLLTEAFPADGVTVEAHGNVLTTVAFLHGLAVAELRRDELSQHDPQYPMLITARAVKPLRDG